MRKVTMNTVGFFREQHEALRKNENGKELDARGFVVVLDVFRQAVTTPLFRGRLEFLECGLRCGRTRQGDHCCGSGAGSGCAEKEAPARGFLLVVLHFCLQGSLLGMHWFSYSMSECRASQWLAQMNK